MNKKPNKFRSSKIMCCDYLNNVIFWRTNFCGIKRKITSKFSSLCGKTSCQVDKYALCIFEEKKKKKRPLPRYRKICMLWKRLQPVIISCITMVFACNVFPDRNATLFLVGSKKSNFPLEIKPTNKPSSRIIRLAIAKEHKMTPQF